MRARSRAARAPPELEGDTLTEREYGLLFDDVAADYDRFRPDHPPVLVDAACEAAGLGPESRVLEVGPGTGKLTVALARRGFRIDAVDPGARLVELARSHVGSEVQFHVTRFEDVDLPSATFDAVFSAAAFHWIDPSVGWAKVARLLRPGGTLALLGSALDGVRNELDDDFHAAFREVLGEAWWQRDPYVVWEGAFSRRGNVSELWGWLMDRDLASADAADLFTDVDMLTAPVPRSESADEVVALIRTTSAYLRLDGPARGRLEGRLRESIERVGGICRSVELATLVLARTRP